jgi:hypothetical protein
MPAGAWEYLRDAVHRPVDIEPDFAELFDGILPIGWSFQTETLPLAGTGDKFAPGVGQTIAREDCMAIGVRNLGTVDLVVANGHANDKPEGLIGPGVALVPSGVFTVLTMPGKLHAFYGRPGELVEVTRYICAPPPVTVNGARRYHPVDLGSVTVSALAYTTPWGTKALLGGFGSRNPSTTTEAVFKLRDGTITGTVLENVSLAPQESTSDEDEDQLCTTASIFVEIVSGGPVELQLRVN